MDGRPHPPAYAPHSWMGFSTGRFVGNALEVRTTHLKQGWYRRNGVPESDQATLVEFFVRHGDRLTHTVVVTDPVYLEEPLVTTTDFYRQPTDHQNWLFPCDDGEQVLGRAPDDVPSYLFGQNPFVGGVPRETQARGGGTSRWRREHPARDRVDAGRREGRPVARASVTPCRRRRARRCRRNRPTARSTSSRCAATSTCWSVTAATSSCRSAAKACSWSTPAPAPGRPGTLAAIRTLSDKPVQFIANTSFLRGSHRRQRGAAQRRR